jgi:hypothetical protein
MLFFSIVWYAIQLAYFSEFCFAVLPSLFVDAKAAFSNHRKRMIIHTFQRKRARGLLCFCVCLPVLYIFTLSLLATYLTNRGM